VSKKELTAMPRAKRRALFLDRDGTIILDRNYLREARGVRLLAGAGRALARIQARGFALVLVSNQSGIGRGLITPVEAEHVHQAVVARLAKHGVELDAAFYCPHAPAEQCRCRKPSPDMFLRAARKLDLDLAASFMVGDKGSDMEAGKRAGCRTILLRPGMHKRTEKGLDKGTVPFRREGLSPFPAPFPLENPDLVASNWTEVLRHVLSQW
jgi:D-glycero-D-manno-heptose 1,7-bisphosphate phosphatase